MTPTTYRVYINGYLTVQGNQSTFCSCALGVPGAQTVITGVTDAAIIDNGTGEVISDANGALFPFAPDANTSRAWSALMGSSIRVFGFLAPVVRPVPGRVCVTFCYTITVNGPFGAVQQALSTARIGGDEANANGTLKNSHLTLVAAGGARAGCILYYKFDRGVGTVAVNHDGAGIAPPTGNMVTGATPATPWAPGKFAGGLRGSVNNASTDFAYCDTGWKGPLAGDMTLHFWCKERNNPGTGLSYINSGVGSWRMFTNGVAGTSLWMRAWGGPDLILPAPAAGSFQDLARRAQGVCVGLTIDAAALQAQWYIDGLASGPPIAIPNGLAVAASASSYKIGKHTSNTSSSVYDLDEYRLCNRVATAAEIRAWCARPSASWGTIGRPCGIWHDCINGPPRLGNPSYAWTVNGTPSMPLLFVIGVRKIPGFDMGIAFPNLRGCIWYTSFDAQFGFGTNSQGELLIPAPIPNQTTLIGERLDTQLLGVESLPTGRRVLMSNAGTTHIQLQ